MAGSSQAATGAMEDEGVRAVASDGHAEAGTTGAGRTPFVVVGTDRLAVSVTDTRAKPLPVAGVANRASSRRHV